MRRPEIASTQKRNRARLRLKRGPGKQIPGGPRRQISPQLPAARPEAAPDSHQPSAAPEATTNTMAEVAARELARCGFGAVRVGALLMRLRLHLQTDRFLAVHRGDALWEAGCMAAALALADIVAGMQEAELGALLPLQLTRNRCAPGTLSAPPGDEPPRYSAGRSPQHVQKRHVPGTPFAPQRTRRRRAPGAPLEHVCAQP